MPLNPKNIDEERQLALATCQYRIVKMLWRAGDQAEYLKTPGVRQELRAIEDVLYSYFLGD